MSLVFLEAQLASVSLIDHHKWPDRSYTACDKSASRYAADTINETMLF